MSIEWLFKILVSDNPSELIRENSEEIFLMIPELRDTVRFKQNNSWHIYDAFEHIMHVVDGVDNNLVLRVAALFHDVGKPAVYSEDENGVGHFYGHWVKSNEVFLEFAERYNLDSEFVSDVAKLIYFHDINFSKLSSEDEEKIAREFSKEDIELLFQLKRSDLLAQSSEYHKLLDDYPKQERQFILKNYN